MPLETYAGSDLRDLLASARAALGDDAVILETRRVRSGFELVAADAEMANRIRARATPVPLSATPHHPDLATGDARRIAIVGPTGAGKTTTIAKLLRRPDPARAGVLDL